MSKLLLKNGIVATFGKNNQVLHGHSILVEDGLIKDISRNISLDCENSVDRVINASGKVILPGMINAHMHLYGAFARGISLNTPPSVNFVDILKNLWWKLDKVLTPEDIYYGSLMLLIEGLKSGTTTVIDHHASPMSIHSSLETIYKAYDDLGIKGVLSYEISDRDGIEKSLEGLEENVSFIDKYRNNFLVKPLIGMHAMFTIGDDILKKIAEQSQRLDTGIHIHLCEDRYDRDYSIDKYGCTPVQRLYDQGLLRRDSLLAHCIHIDHHDISLIKESDAVVLHNPQSNMNNAVGCMPLNALYDAEILLGLGTDGMTNNMFESLNFASLIHKHQSQDSNIGWNTIQEIVLENNPAIVQRIWGHSIGTIETGSIADMIIMDYDPPTPIDERNFWGHMLFGLTKNRVEYTISNGKVLYDNGSLTIPGVDEVEINQKCRQLSKELWDRFSK